MEDWLDIIEQENNHDHDNQNDDDDHFELPPPEIIDLNQSRTLQKEIVYKFDDDDPETIIRSEEIYQIINTKKKISNSVINRKKNWVKFGQCKNIPIGQIEKGITNKRDDYVQFVWTGKDNKKISLKPPPTKRNNNNNKKKDDKKKDDNKIIISDTSSNKNESKKYEVKKYDMYGFDENKVDIKISNLPQWTEWNDIKQLIDTLYRNHLNVRYPPKYKIKLIPNERRLAEWNKYKDSNPYYAQRLAEYDRIAIVEFEDLEKAQKAIQILNGHRYEYNILRAEKAKPRKT